MNLDATRRTWARGSYAVVGEWLAETSRSCLDGIDVDGVAVLDIACGTGAVAIEAARRGAQAVGVDLTPTMLDEAARRAHAAGVTVDWREGSFTDLSAHRDFDVVTSAFGVMFAEDATAVAEQLSRTVRPGGIVSIAAWAPGGAFGGPASGILELVPELTPKSDVTRWATRDGLEGVMTGTGLDVVAVRNGNLRLTFPSIGQAVAQMRRWSAPWIVAFEALEAKGLADRGRDVMVDHLSGFSSPLGDRVVIDVEYAISHLHRC